MKVLIAIDSFKGSLSSTECSLAIASGIKDVYQNAEIAVLPLADGGEGTVDAILKAVPGQIYSAVVKDPVGNPHKAEYGILAESKTAVIEIAEACGLPLVPLKDRNPMITTTHGVGELIIAAYDKGCREFIVGLGGSSTTDGGIGMLRALGYRFLDAENNVIETPGGQVLSQIAKIDDQHIHPVVRNGKFKIACDVSNPLFGKEGAAYVFGPQKGASKEEVILLDAGLKHLSDIMENYLDLNISLIKGTGAAGGLGAAFLGFTNATLSSGIELILESTGIKNQMSEMNIVITGEGKLDIQTSMGKAVTGVARLAETYRIPVIALAGSITNEAAQLNEIGVTSYHSVLPRPMSLEEAMLPDETRTNLKTSISQIFRLLKAIQFN